MISRYLSLRILRGGGWLLALVAALGTAQGAIGLSDGNSTITIDPTTQAGMSSWAVDGQNQLAKQWFWYRVGAGAQSSIDTLGAPSITSSNASSVTTTYTGNPQFSLSVKYSLTGGAPGDGTSGLTEQIRIQNLTGSALNFHFYQYADFSVAGIANNAMVQLGKNIGLLYNEALVTSGGISISEVIDSVVTPGANRGEANIYDSTLNNLNLTMNYILNNVDTAGPGHATWTFEWDPTIAAGTTFIINGAQSITGVSPVPEPASWALLSFGLLGFVVMQHYRRRRA